MAYAIARTARSGLFVLIFFFLTSCTSVERLSGDSPEERQEISAEKLWAQRIFEDLRSANSDFCANSGVKNLGVRNFGARKKSRAGEDEASKPCRGYLVVKTTSKRFRARSDGTRVLIDRGTLKYLKAQSHLADDALAFILAHELAHNMIGHRYGRLLELPILGKKTSRQNLGREPFGHAVEREADYLGSYLAIRAGYDPSAGWRLMYQLSADSPPKAREKSSRTHPALSARARWLARVARDVKDRLRQEQRLTPQGWR